VNSNRKYKILVFGNPLLKNDRLPLKLIDRLKKKFPYIEFKELDPTEDLEKEGEELFILDTVEKIDKVILITDVDSIRTSKIYSMHDFDLGHMLKILKRFNYINKVKIFGVPMGIKEKDALEQLTKLIKANLS